jgi:hypothetical protein
MSVFRRWRIARRDESEELAELDVGPAADRFMPWGGNLRTAI